MGHTGHAGTGAVADGRLLAADERFDVATGGTLTALVTAGREQGVARAAERLAPRGRTGNAELLQAIRTSGVLGFAAVVERAVGAVARHHRTPAAAARARLARAVVDRVRGLRVERRRHRRAFARAAAAVFRVGARGRQASTDAARRHGRGLRCATLIRRRGAAEITVRLADRLECAGGVALLITAVRRERQRAADGWLDAAPSGGEEHQGRPCEDRVSNVGQAPGASRRRRTVQAHDSMVAPALVGAV